MLTNRLRTYAAATACMVAAGGTTLSAAPVHAAPAPLSSPFYSYSGRTPLKDVKLGTVLKTRTVRYHLQGIALPIKVTQLQFRTEDMRGRPRIGVTSVLHPLLGDRSGKPERVVSYQSFYDSLNPADEPSAAIAGGRGLGGGLANAETLVVAPLLLDGYTVNIPDTEGQAADFAAGPEYGKVTLDSLKAISGSPATGISRTTKLALMGYSGGAIGTQWAAELAAKYAPSVSRRIVGSTMGGVLVSPGHNLHYISGSGVWAGVMGMAIVGIARAFHIDLTPYASAYGRRLMAKFHHESIATALGTYPGLTWQKLVKPRWAVPEHLPILVRMVNKLIMGTHGTPTAPLEITQGSGGVLEGTAANKPGIGPGDGVMIAGDVRSLAREYCHRGVRVDYHQVPLSHITTVPSWITTALPWIGQRFAGKKAPSSCGSIKPGNSLAPIKRK